MGEFTGISWTHKTFNGWIGCTMVSLGCVNCYAEEQDDKRFSKTLGGATKENPIPHWGKGAPRYRTMEDNWKQPLKWNRDAANTLRDYPDACTNGHRLHAEVQAQLGNVTCAGKYRDGKFDPTVEKCGAEIIRNVPFRPKVFCASLSDWLDDEVPIEWLADLLKLIYKTPNLDWQLLTKRPENWKPRLQQVVRLGTSLYGPDDVEILQAIDNWVTCKIQFPNVWLGTSTENQAMADKRIPILLTIPANVRFLSVEPLLEEIDLSTVRHGNDPDLPEIEAGEIHWVIVGGESGTERRDCGVDAIVSIAEQCKGAGVPVFVKQDSHLKPGQQGRIPDAIFNLKQFPNP